MRNKLFLTIHALAFLVTNTLAQVNLNKKISIDVQHMPVTQVLKVIEQENDLFFAYNPTHFSTAKSISISKENTSLKSILNEVLNARFSYKPIGDHIILHLKNEVSAVYSYNISGTVHNANNTPLDSVIIYAIKDKHAVISDKNGAYTISLKTQPQYINISCPYYKDTLILAEDIKKGILIQLQRKPQPLVKKIEPAEIQSIETSFADLGVVKHLVPPQSVYIAQQIKVRDFIPFQLSFVPGLGTGQFCSGLQDKYFSLNILGGYSSGLRGVEIGGLANIIQKDVSGVQFAGITNIVNGNTNGLQCAGILNYNFDHVNGVQIGGIGNIARNEINGFQLGGIFNINKGDVSGIQVGGVVNVNTADVRGLQLSGISNNSKGTIMGSQIAGTSNFSASVKGLQLSGIANICSENMSGIQIAGLINKTKKLKGVQIGLVNIADSIDGGFQLGLFNIVKNGYRAFEFTTNESYVLDCYYKTGGKRVYSILNVGIDEDQLGVGYGLGVIQPIFPKLSASIDAMSTYMLSSNAQNIYQGQKSSTRLAINYDLVKSIGITAGVSFNFFDPYEDDVENTTSDKWSFQNNSSSLINQSVQNNQAAKWVGWFAGIRL